MKPDRERKGRIVPLLLWIAGLAEIALVGPIMAMRNVFGLYECDDAIFGIRPFDMQYSAMASALAFVISVIAFLVTYCFGKRRSLKRASLVSGGVIVVVILVEWMFLICIAEVSF